jgi:hypothetical protein
MDLGGMMGAGGQTGGTPAERHHCDEDADCADGPCQRVPDVPGATRYCLAYRMRPEVHCAEGNTPEDEGACCSDMDCVAEDQQGLCVSFLVGYCGGVQPPEISTCRYHGCQTDADCTEGHICAPAGFPGSGRVVNYCLQARCATDADCADRAGGQCRLLSSAPHCYWNYGFTCTYDDDPCRGAGDCGLSSSCIDTGDGVECQEEQPVP